MDTGARRTSRTRRRRNAIWLIRVLLVVAASAGLALLIWLVASQGPASWLETRFWRFVLGLLSSLPILGDPLKEEFQVLRETYPLLVGAMVGALAGGVAAWPLGPRLYDRFFAAFDDELLAPIRKPRPFDPLRGTLLVDGRLTPRSMEWVEPRTNKSREAVWASLRHLSRSTSGEKRFGWALLLGRPGGGKSRLAVEFARRELSKREGPKALPRTRRARLASWWRLQVMRRLPGDGDPWDAGLLVPGVAGESRSVYPGWSDRLAINPAWLAKLRLWQPRRPTILLLDDPRPGEAREIVETLAEARFLHPVRLLIINQTEPADLSLRGGSRKGTGGRIVPPVTDALVLADDSAWNDADLRVALLGVRRPPPRDREHLVLNSVQGEHVLAITRGNPLLIELALMAILHGQPVMSLTTDNLLTERVERIGVAIRDAGFGEEFISLLALATLAGSGEGVPKDRLLQMRGWREEQLGDLSRLFPSEAGDVRNTMPPVRPELIGDAFVEHVFANSGYSDAWHQRFVADAWALNPGGTLRTALRLGARDSLLGRALALGPPEDAGLDPVLVAAAFIEAACVVRSDDFVRQPSSGLLPSAEKRAQALAPGEAITVIERMLALPAQLREGDILLSVNWARCQCILLERAFTTTSSSELDMLASLLPEMFRLWIERMGLRPSVLAELLPQASTDLGPPLPAADFVRCVVAAFAADEQSRQSVLAMRVAELLAARAGAFLTAVVDFPERAATLGRLAVLRRAAEHDAADFATLVQRIGDADTSDPSIALGRARGWRAACWATAVRRTKLEAREACAGYAQQIDAIVAPWPEERDLQYERAIVARYLVYATEDDSKSCVRNAQWVDAIAALWPEDRGMQYERVQALRSAVFAINDDLDLRLQYASQIDVVSKPWSEYRDIQIERVNAWCEISYGMSGDPENCARYAQYVDDIAAAWPQDRDFQYRRARAWCAVAFTRQRDREVCMRHVLVVDAIAAPWPQDRDLQRQRAQGWTFAAFVTGDRETCIRHAQRVDIVAAPWPYDHELQYSRATAWRCVTFAMRDDRELCMRHAKRVDAIASTWPQERVLQYERAQAWCCVTLATQDDPEACERHARMVDAIAAPWPRDRELQYERAQAWQFVAFATRSDVGACQAAVAMVEAIAACFPDDQPIQDELGTARNYLLS